MGQERRVRRAGLAVALLLVLAPAARATDSAWIYDGPGFWSEGTKWDTGVPPNGVGDTARLTHPLSMASAITLDSNVTLGTLVIGDPANNGYIIMPLGGQSLVFDAPGGASIEFGWGYNSIDAPVLMNQALVLRSDQTGDRLDFYGPIGGGPLHAFHFEGPAGFVNLAAANTFSGPVILGVGNASLWLSENGAATSAAYAEVHLGAGLNLSNYGLNLANRWASPVTLRGGYMTLDGKDGELAAEVFPVVNLQAGSSSIGCYSPWSGVGTTELSITTLNRAPGTTVMFYGHSLGTMAKILVNGPGGPPLDDGILGGWAVTLGDFASYIVPGVQPEGGIVPLSTYYTGDINLATPSDNVLVAAPATLTGNRSINSLKTEADPVVDLGGHTLNIGSGGLLAGWAPHGTMSPLSGAAVTTLTNGRLTAGGGMAGAELFVHPYSGPMRIDAQIVDNPGGAVSLIVSNTMLPWELTNLDWDPVVLLGGLNTYTGSTVVASATIGADSDARFGHPDGSITLVGGTLAAVDSFTSPRRVHLEEAAALAATFNEVLTLTGTVTGSVRHLYIKNAYGSYDPGLDPSGGTVALEGPNTFTGHIWVGVPFVNHGVPTGGPDARPLAEVAYAMATLQVHQDANFGDPANDVTLQGGMLRVSGTFAAGPGRVFTVQGGGGVFAVDGDQVFTLPDWGQLAGTGPVIKAGEGKWAIEGGNLDFASVQVDVDAGVLELRRRLALGSTPVIALWNGDLSLKHDRDVVFPHRVAVNRSGTIDVGGMAAADPILGVSSLSLAEGSTLTVTGAPGYQLAVQGTTGAEGTCGIRTQTSDLILQGPFEVLADHSTVFKTGPGTLVIAGPQQYADPCWLAVHEGVLIMGTDAGSAGPPPVRTLGVEVAGVGSQAQFRVTQHLSDVLLHTSGQATLTAGAAKTLVTSRLNIAEAAGVPQGTLDLTDNNLVVDYGHAGLASPLAQVARWISAGLNLAAGGYWNGPGITSSTARDDAWMLTAVGVIDNADPWLGGKTDLEGEPVSPSSILVKYTYWGDANLDGRVTFDDYDVIDYYYWFPPATPAETGWWTGDFDYDGDIDFDDYDRIDYAYWFQGAPLSASGAAGGAVPEPGTVALVAIGLGAAVARRSRGRRA